MEKMMVKQRFETAGALAVKIAPRGPVRHNEENAETRRQVQLLLQIATVVLSARVDIMTKKKQITTTTIIAGSVG